MCCQRFLLGILGGFGCVCLLLRLRVVGDFACVRALIGVDLNALDCVRLDCESVVKSALFGFKIPLGFVRKFLNLESKLLLDSVNSFGLRFCVTDCASFVPLRFCPCPFFRISLDFVCVSESVELDSVNALDSAPPRFCIFSFFRISALDSVIVFESTLDSVDSLFLKLAFSRIFSNFFRIACLRKRKRGFPSPRSPQPPLPALPSPEKNKAPLFLLRFACNPLGLFAQSGRVPRCILV